MIISHIFFPSKYYLTKKKEIVWSTPQKINGQLAHILSLQIK